MEDKNIVLIGFMGAGKSKVSLKLASVLKRKRISTDEFIEKKQGKTVSEIFKEKGEAHFRTLERKAVSEIAKMKEIIVDCGGGVILDPANMKNLKKGGIIFYLKTSPDIVFKRLKTQSNRPLLKGDDPLKKIKELLSERRKLYEQADIVIDTDLHTIEDTTSEILKALK